MKLFYMVLVVINAGLVGIDIVMLEDYFAAAFSFIIGLYCFYLQSKLSWT